MRRPPARLTRCVLSAVCCGVLAVTLDAQGQGTAPDPPSPAAEPKFEVTSQLATMLGNMLGRPIYDRTNLTGSFDIQLEYTPDQMPQLPPGVTLPPGLTLPSPDGPSLSTALQEQLGLKLENTRGPVDVIVIDSVSQPEPD